MPVNLEGYLDHVITMGAYEDTVTRAMAERGFPADRIHNLGETVKPSLDDILDTITRLIEGEQGVLIGMVNIHSEQAEVLIEHFAQLRGSDPHEELDGLARPAASTARDPAGPSRRRLRRPSGDRRCMTTSSFPR
ncbi:MAG: hypothetical protein WKF40_05235 [Thermoleophilaceae bacterium]